MPCVLHGSIQDPKIITVAQTEINVLSLLDHTLVA